MTLTVNGAPAATVPWGMSALIDGPASLAGRTTVFEVSSESCHVAENPVSLPALSGKVTRTG